MIRDELTASIAIRRNRIRMAPLVAVSRFSLIVAALLAAIGCRSTEPARAQIAPLSVQMNLARLVDESENVVLARVTGIRAEPHPQFQNLNTIVVTLEVIEPLKGAPGGELIFRQYVGGAVQDKSPAGYSVGQEVVLMLRKPSAEGLTSPVGFEQGRFLVERDAAGNRTVRNGLDNAALFDGVDTTSPGLKSKLSPTLQGLVASHRSGALDYGQFQSIVAAQVSSRQPAR
jgi:hypothetical protein